MFKAKLINDFNYYRLLRIGSIIGAIGIIVVLFPFHALGIPIGLMLLLCIPIIGLYPYMQRHRQRFEKTFEGTSIAMDATKITLLKDENQRIIPIKELDKIIVLENYRIPDDGIKLMWNGFMGRPQKNFIIIEQKGERQRFDFIIDSYYGIGQIKKVIQQWIEKGMIVEKI